MILFIDYITAYNIDITIDSYKTSKSFETSPLLGIGKHPDFKEFFVLD